MTDHTIKTEFGYLFAKDIGCGGKYPLLIVHGGPDWDHSYLLPAAKLIAKNRRVVLFDIRGCGRSSKLTNLADYSVKAASSDVIAVARSFDSFAHVLGFSFGGQLAVSAVKEYSEKFASLILASSTPGGSVEWKNEPTERASRLLGMQTFSDAFSKNEPCSGSLTQRLAIEGLPLDVWDQNKIPQIRKIIEAIQFSGEWCKAWKAGLLKPETSSNIEWLKNSRISTLILHPQFDFRFPRESFQGLKNSHHTRFQTLKNSGHLAPLEQTEEWARSVVSFLDNVENGLRVFETE